MSLDDQFNKAAEDVKKLKSQPEDAELIELYGLFKQATIGDINTTRPGMLDFKGKAKWDGWNAKKGKTQEESKQEYVALVEKLISKYGLKD